MLNIKAEYENNMKLKEDIEKNEFASIDKSKYRVFVAINKGNDTTNTNIIKYNKGLPRALKTIAWGEWFCGIYKDLPTGEKTEKIEQIMREWKKKVYDDNKEKNTGKWISSNEKDSRLDAILEENSYYRLLCEAVALGKDGLGTGRTEIPKIMVPMEIVRICKVEKKRKQEILLMAIYYHYAPKDEDGYILLEKLDFEKWSNGTGGYLKVLKDLSDGHIIEEILIEEKEEMDEIVKVNIRENLKWKDDDISDYMIEFIDNGERGMARQAESVFEILKKIDLKMKSHYWGISEETKEKIRHFFVEVALNECNWNDKVEKKKWKMAQEEEKRKEQSKKRKELFKKATDEGLTNDNISDILVMDE